ncbi:MAG: glycosyltransferase family 2 protein [Comamonadaceae bacterium]|nr:glycosyltransferase family 2 protein [Comamonadaceae bacterium]
MQLARDLPAAQLDPAGQAADVGYTVINYNTAAQTLRCIESLARCTPPPAWILVLDNASAAADFDKLKRGLQPADKSHIQLFRSDANLGFAAGSNFLIDQLLNIPTCQYIGLLNNDAVAKPELVQLLRAALLETTHPIGMSGGRMHKLHQPEEVDTLGICLYASLMPADRKDTADPYLGPTGGCCLLTRGFVRDIIAITGYCFDARFFCYCEDTDLALRANLLGYRPAYVDQLLALHEGQASAKITDNNFIAYHGLRNTMWMQYKCIPTSILLRHSGWLLLAHLLTIVRQALSGRFCVVCRAYRDALKQLPVLVQERNKLQSRLRTEPSMLSKVMATSFYRLGYTCQVASELINRFHMRGF